MFRPAARAATARAFASSSARPSLLRRDRLQLLVRDLLLRGGVHLARQLRHPLDGDARRHLARCRQPGRGVVRVVARARDVQRDPEERGLDGLSSSSARVNCSLRKPVTLDQRAMYGEGAYCACRAQSRSMARGTVSRCRSRSSCRSSNARFSSRSVRTRSPLAFALVIRAIYELDPPEAAETLALIESVGRADGPEHVRGTVVAQADGRAVLEFPETNWGGDVTLLVSSLLAGEWADSAAFARLPAR